MKKLLFITWSISYGYGTEKSLADILNRMDYTEYSIDVLPLFKNSESNILNSNIKVLDSLIDYEKENFDEQKALKHYYDILANPLKFNKLLKNRYDCVIACNHNAPSYFASYMNNTPKVVWIRGDMNELNYHQFSPTTVEYSGIKQEYNMQKNVLKTFDNIVVISEAVKKALKEKFEITENIHEIPNSVDIEKVKQLSQEKIEIPKKTLFTTLGRLDENKNQILLLKAAKIVKETRDDFEIYLLGDGEERNKLEKYIEENDLKNNVKILGFQENPYPYIKASTATVLTSLSEGFSLALAESAILDTPIISTDVGIAKELIQKYDCGTLIGYDEKELADAILKYIEQSEKSAEKENFHIGNEFDIQTELERTVQVIEDTIDKAEKKKKMKRLPYPVEKIDYYDLENYQIKEELLYILEVKKDNVKYEYLINRKKDNNKLIVFNNGAIAGGNVKVPVFQRHSWASILKTSSVFCMDPTLYVNDLSVGWGVGKNENYYLENSSLILKTIIQKMKIALEDTVIYGTSAGGFLSIIMGTYLKGAKVVADNTQLDVSNWAFISAVDYVMGYCFDNIGTALKYPERFNVVDTFIKHNYVPKIYLHVNLCSKVDNSMQLAPFLERIETMKNIKEYNNIEITLHYEEKKGHDGLSQEEALETIYKILDV
ncbi:MAG: glycosyltransferase [Clostridia bacterium]|nr:glycosyltransferase [Clostridia bacterium]